MPAPTRAGRDTEANFKVKAYGIAGSNATRTAKLLLDYKSVPYKFIILPNEVHRPILQLLGFAGQTVPAVKINGHRLQTSLDIARGLDQLIPRPSLYPSDPVARRKVEVAEEWAEEVLQVPCRLLAFCAVLRNGARADYRSFFEGPWFGWVPRSVAVALSRPLLALTARRVGSSSAATVREALEELPSMIDYVDALIAKGIIGGESPNAADFQIAPSLMQFRRFVELRPLIEGRPAEELALRRGPQVSGVFEARLPESWMQAVQVGRHQASRHRRAEPQTG